MNQPTQPVQRVYTPVDISDADFMEMQEQDPRLEAQAAEFDKFISEMKDSDDYAKITVSRKATDSKGNPIGRKLFQCFECGHDDYTFSQLCERIRTEYGTGLYQIQGRDSNGKFKFGKTIGIQAPMGDSAENAGNDVGALIDRFSVAMQQQQERTESMMKEVMGIRQPQTDIVGTLVKLTPLLTPLLTTLVTKLTDSPQPKGITETLTEIKLVKELFDNGDGDNSEANMYSLLGETVKAFGPAIGAALTAGQQQGTLDANGRPVKQLPAPTHEENEEMKQNVKIMINNAKNGTDAAEFAGLIVNMLPEEQEEALWQFISQPDAVDNIIAIEPEAAQYREWFEELRTALIDFMSDGGEPGTDESGTGEGLQDDAGGASLDENSDAVVGEELIANDDESDPSTDT